MPGIKEAMAPGTARKRPPAMRRRLFMQLADARDKELQRPGWQSNTFAGVTV
jgi:hypothetical protein